MKQKYWLVLSGAVCLFSTPVTAMSVYESDYADFSATLDGMYGAFHSDKSYDPLGAGNPNKGSVFWQEGFMEYGLEGEWHLNEQSSLEARVSGLSSATWNDGDAANFTNGDERKNDLEDAWLSWRSGNLISALGNNGLEISAGRQTATLGDGFLLHGDVVSFGKGSLYPGVKNRGGAYYLAGRENFSNSVIVRIGGDEGLRSDFMWLDSTNSVQDKVELALANVEYVADIGTLGLSYLKGLDAESDVPGDKNPRDGMNVYTARGQGNLGVTDLSLSGQVVYQDLRTVSGSETAWYAEAGWAFSDVYAQPTVSYRFGQFSSGYDPLFYGFGRGFGTWYQGEVAANYAGPLSTNTDIHHLNFMATPNEAITVGALFFDFKTDDKGLGILDGQEVDLFVDWAVNNHFSVTPLVGVYKAKHDISSGGSQLGDKGHNLYGQVLLAWSF